MIVLRYLPTKDTYDSLPVYAQTAAASIYSSGKMDHTTLLMGDVIKKILTLTWFELTKLRQCMIYNGPDKSKKPDVCTGKNSARTM